jgi:hypothetical protein
MRVNLGSNPDLSVISVIYIGTKRSMTISNMTPHNSFTIHPGQEIEGFVYSGLFLFTSANQQGQFRHQMFVDQYNQGPAQPMAAHSVPITAT